MGLATSCSGLIVQKILGWSTQAYPSYAAFSTITVPLSYKPYYGIGIWMEYWFLCKNWLAEMSKMQELFTECKFHYNWNGHHFRVKKWQYLEKVTWPTLPPKLYRGLWGKSTIFKISILFKCLKEIDHAGWFHAKLYEYWSVPSCGKLRISVFWDFHWISM